LNISWHSVYHCEYPNLENLSQQDFTRLLSSLDK
jgi:hypothetical protein